MTITSSLKNFYTENESEIFSILPFHLEPDILNWLVSALISSYVTFRFDDIIFHFTLSAVDFALQQDPKSWRTSHMNTNKIKNEKMFPEGVKQGLIFHSCNINSQNTAWKLL